MWYRKIQCKPKPKRATAYCILFVYYLLIKSVVFLIKKKNGSINSWCFQSQRSMDLKWFQNWPKQLWLWIFPLSISPSARWISDKISLQTICNVTLVPPPLIVFLIFSDHRTYTVSECQTDNSTVELFCSERFQWQTIKQPTHPLWNVHLCLQSITEYNSKVALV